MSHFDPEACPEALNTAQHNSAFHTEALGFVAMLQINTLLLVFLAYAYKLMSVHLLSFIIIYYYNPLAVFTQDRPVTFKIQT